jgi:hypothetical protein
VLISISFCTFLSATFTILVLGIVNDEIKNMIVNAINKKPEKHEFNTVIDNISNRQMVEIGG